MKRLEQPMLFIERNPNTRIADAEVQQPLLRVREEAGVRIVACFQGALPVRGWMDFHDFPWW